MKKLVLTLIVALGFCGLVSAQNYESYWPDFYGPNYESQGCCVAAIQLDGQIITAEYEGWDALEVAFFVGEECRGAGSNFPNAVPFVFYLYNGYVEEYGDPFPIIDGAPLYFTDPGSEVTVKLYDHLRGIEYNDCVVTLEGEPYIILTGADNDQGWFDPENPIMLSFTSPAAEGYELTVEGYGEDNANTNLGYYLIASPVMELVEPTAANGFLTDDFDLYYFDQGQDKEWVNYEDQYNGGWKLVNGMGYLYASETTTTLQFTGTPQTEPVVHLEWKDWVEFPGLNLIGNPLPEEAYADRNYYRMNTETRNSLVPAGIDEPIGAMEGIFVVATEEGEFVTFSTAPAKLKTELILNLRPSETNTVIDRAIVNFDEGQELPKIEILNRDSKIYFPKENQDYAMINAGGMGEIPFCFKAVKNGNFTLSFTSKEVTFTYLHLIDNMTGANVDLLKTPTYSFDALTTDYANRFSLVLSTGSSVDGDSFSFVNAGGNLCIYGIEGEATLQVVDVLGHMISSETFSGSIEKKLNVAPGVYMLRLIQGNDVKVQKTVIK